MPVETASPKMEVVAYTSLEDIRRVRKGKTGDIYASQKWEGSDDCVFTVPLVRQSDALAKLAEKDAEIARLRETGSRLLAMIDGVSPDWSNGVTDSTGSMDEGEVVAGGIIDDFRKALKGSEA